MATADHCGRFWVECIWCSHMCVYSFLQIKRSRRRSYGLVMIREHKAYLYVELEWF